jgi:hypothetical protein
MMTKKSICLLLLGITTITPTFAQKFSKKDKEREVARAQNYFHGASFTVTAGYLHSWMTNGDIPTTSSDKFGRSEQYRNTHESVNVGFLWDQSFSRHWGMQHGLYYVQKGGELTTFHDNGLGVGKLPYSSERISIDGIELQGLGRYFIPLTHESRLSVGAGWYLTKFVGSNSNINNWDLGLQCQVGYDYRHLSVSATYQPGLYRKVTDNSDARLNALMLNVGFRFWRK